MISYVQDMSQPQYTETIQKSIEKEEVGLFFNLCVLLWITIVLLLYCRQTLYKQKMYRELNLIIEEFCRF